MKQLNLRAKTIKLLEGNTGINLGDLGLGNGFSAMTPKTQETTEKNKLDFGTLKDIIKKVETWEFHGGLTAKYLAL